MRHAVAALCSVWLAGCAHAIDPPLLPARLEFGVESQAAAAPTECLTVATYNVHWLSERPMLRRDFHRMRDVDVWCLQEVRLKPGDGALRSLEGSLSDLLPGHWYGAVVPVNRLRELHSRDWEAQAIVSRIPIVCADVWELDSGGEKRRVALTALLRIGRREVLVVNTDHEPSFLSWRDGNAVQVRALVERLKSESTPCVVTGGDFNCSGRVFWLQGNDGHIQQIDAAMAEAGATPVHTNGPTFIAGPIHLRLDRLYLRGLHGVAQGVGEWCSGSDHRPVWCRVRIDE